MTQTRWTLRRGWRAGLASLAVAVAGLASGCTTVPQQPFVAYRDAFDAARVASENVLADYGAVRVESAKLTPPRSAAEAGSLSEQLGLDAWAPPDDTTGDDALDVRLRAWDIAGEYNDALLALASGASEDEVGAAVNGLLDSLQSFPVGEVAEAAGGVVPFAPVVTNVVQMIQDDVAARRFAQAVRKASPLMHDFTELLRADAVLFRKARIALLDQQFADAQIAVVIAADRVREVATAHGWSEGDAAQVRQFLAQANGHAVLVGESPLFAAIELPAGAPPASSAAAAAADLAELQRVGQELERQAQSAREVVARMQAYGILMDQYGELVRELSSRVGELAAAVDGSRGRLPSIDRLERILSNVRVAQEIYTQSR
jgi:hypothetical protein